MLSSILGQTGREYGTADVMRNVINSQRGRLENMSQDVLGQYNSTKAGFMDRYNMMSPLYQSALQTEESEKMRAYQAAEAEKQRQFQARQAALSRGGGGSSAWPTLPTRSKQTQQQSLTPEQYTKLLETDFVKLARLPNGAEKQQLAQQMLSYLPQSTYYNTNKGNAFLDKLNPIAGYANMLRTGGNVQPFAGYGGSWGGVARF
jgi:hypothetical protein